MATNSSKADNLPSCPICLHIYNADTHQPKFLRCHHRVCQLCCFSLNESNCLKCPVCRTFTIVDPGCDLSSFLRTDHEFLSLISIYMENCLSPISQPLEIASQSRETDSLPRLTPSLSSSQLPTRGYESEFHFPTEDIIRLRKIEQVYLGSTSITDELELRNQRLQATLQDSANNEDETRFINVASSSHAVDESSGNRHASFLRQYSSSDDLMLETQKNSLIVEDSNKNSSSLNAFPIVASSSNTNRGERERGHEFSLSSTSSSDSESDHRSRHGYKNKSRDSTNNKKRDKGKSWKIPIKNSTKCKKDDRHRKRESSTSSVSCCKDEDSESISSDSDFKTKAKKIKTKNASKISRSKKIGKSKFQNVRDELASLMHYKSGGNSIGTRPKSKRGAAEDKFFLKDVFLASVSDHLEMPPTTENKSLEKAGLGLRLNVSFKVNKSSAHVSRVLHRTFPRLQEIELFYVCTKAPGVGRRVLIQHYSIPSSQDLKRLNGKVIILVPIKKSLPYELADEMTVHCDHCSLDIHIRMWASHLNECQNPSEEIIQSRRSSSRKTQ